MDPNRLMEVPSYRRHARAHEARRERAADEMAGRTVWCVSGVGAGRAPAQRLHDLMSRLEAHGVAARRSRLPTFGRGEEDAYAQTERYGDALLGDRVGPDDVIVLNDVQAAPLALAARERGAHVVWFGAAALGEERASRAWGFLQRQGTPIDAFVLTARRRPRGPAVERVTLAMPSAGMVAAAEIGSPDEAAWLRVLAAIVHDDRDETVGGRRHARPAVALR
jgi:hypothetical protein